MILSERHTKKWTEVFSKLRKTADSRTNCGHCASFEKTSVEAVKQARQQGVPTFGITNSDITPLAKHCDRYVVAGIASTAFTGSYVAPLAAINTIIVACSLLHPQRTLAYLLENEKEYTTGARWYCEKSNAHLAESNGALAPPAKNYHE